MNEEFKDYLLPGMIVKVNKDLDNRPVMVVKGKETNRFIPNKEESGKDFLQGIKCFWFSTDQKYQEAVFNTKDLIRVE